MVPKHFLLVEHTIKFTDDLLLKILNNPGVVVIDGLLKSVNPSLHEFFSSKNVHEKFFVPMFAFPDDLIQALPEIYATVTPDGTLNAVIVFSCQPCNFQLERFVLSR